MFPYLLPVDPNTGAVDTRISRGRFLNVDWLKPQQRVRKDEQMGESFDPSDQNGWPPEPEDPNHYHRPACAERMWPHISRFQTERLVHDLRLVRLRHIPRGMWWTRAERQMSIGEMTDGHLENTIAMLKRMNLHRTRKYAELVAERSMRRLAETKRLARAHRKAAKKR